MRVGLTACASCFAGRSMTSFFEQGFKLLLVAWPEGIALFIGAFFVFAQGIPFHCSRSPAGDSPLAALQPSGVGV